MRRRNPYANRHSRSARQLRRDAALSPRQQARVVRQLKTTANRLIREGLEEKLAEPAGASASP